MITRLLLGLSVLLFAIPSVAVEEPKYTIIEKSEAFELRAYNSMIVAETLVSESLDKTSNAGFKLIADYILAITPHMQVVMRESA